MADYRVIDRRKVATDGDSVAVRLAKQKQAAATAQAETTASTKTSYYTPTVFGAETESRKTAVETARTAMEAQAATVQEAGRTLEESRTLAERKRERYYNLQGKLQGEDAPTLYQQLEDEWTEAVNAYRASAAAYRSACDAYRPYEDSYNQAVEDYNGYVTQQQEAYQSWRSSIRSGEEIRAEQESYQNAERELEKLMKRNNLLALGNTDDVTSRVIASNRERIAQLQEYLGSDGEKARLLQEELEWSEYYKYEDLRNEADFAQLSRYQSTANGGEARLDPLGGGMYGSGFDDLTYDYINRNGAAVTEQTRNNQLNDMSYLESMTDDEIAMYNYVYAKQGTEAAREYLDSIRSTLTARQMGQTKELIGEMSQGGLGGTVASLLSVGLSPISGVQSLAGQLASTATGREIDPNASYNLATTTKNTIRQSVGGQIEEALGEKWGPVGSFAYNVGMSMADMLMDRMVGSGLTGGQGLLRTADGVETVVDLASDAKKIKAALDAGGTLNAYASPVIQTLIGSRAMAETVMDAKGRGLSDSKALGLGAISAAAELITERIGLDELLKLKNEDAARSLLGRIWKGAVGEGLEEGTTNIINLLADIVVSGEKSEFRQNVESYKAAGYDDSDAAWRAVGDAARDWGADVLGGMISGGIFGGMDRSAADTQQKEKNAAETAAPEAVSEESAAAAMRDGGTAAAGNETNQKSTSANDTAEVEEPSLREAALRENNPLISGIAPTPESRDKAERMAKATSNAQVTGALYDVDDATVEEAERIGKLIGKDVFFFAEDPTEYGIKHGLWDERGNAIGINVKSKNPMAATIGHELTHSTEIADSYGRLRKLVLQEIVRNGGDLAAMRQQRQDLYAKNGVTLENAEDIDREIMAKYVEEHLLTDEQSIRQLVRDDRSVARRILDWLDGLLAKFGNQKSKEREFVRQAREIYRQALAEADGKRNRRDLRSAMRQAYAEGDDAAGDAALDALEAESGMDWLLGGDPEDDLDDSMFEFSFGGEGADWEEAGFRDYDIVSAVYEIRNAKAKRGHDLVKIGTMPELYRNLFGLSGDVYVSNAHLYQNMVSRATAESEGRFSMDAQADYHDLGEEKIINAIEQFQDPAVLMESLKDFNEPRLVALLDERGNDGQNLIAVLELYAPVSYPGKSQRRNHVLMTIYEKNSLPEYIGKTAEKGRILHIKEGLQQKQQASLRLAGAVSEETLKKNVAQFNKKVKVFKERNRISYSIGENDGTYTEDEGATQAHRQGYPVLKGEQVVPMRTWVRAEDPMKGPDREIVTDGDGNVIRNSNYGLVTGFGERPGTLTVSFRNKHRTDPNTGKTMRRDDVSIAYEDLTPVPGEYQMTKEEARSLFAQEPEREGNHQYTDEELAEIDELLRRADMDADAGERKTEWVSIEPDEVKGKAKEHLRRAQRKLAADAARALDVPRGAKREFLDPIAQEIAGEYLRNGAVSPEVRNRLFETAWEQGRIVDQEFYDTYKEVKDHLRTTAVTLGETDWDSRDWNEFRKQAFGTLKIVQEGGLPVDTLWQELQEMAPALFPDDILNPDDQLKHMLQVGRSIQKVEKTLDEYYGPDAALMKQMTRNDFDAAVQESIHSLWEVKRYADERKADAAGTDEEGEALTETEVAALYPKLKDARRAMEKAVARNLLSKADKNQVQRLLRHDIQPEQLDPETDNVRGILAVYEAKKAFEEAAEPIRRYNRQQKEKRYAQAEALIDGAGEIVDKKRGFLYSRETMERNVRDIVKNPEAAERIVKTFFKPVHDSAAEATRMKNSYRDRVRALELSRKVRKGDQVSEAYAVQFYGEISDILRMFEDSKFRLKQRDGKGYKEWQAELQKLWEENPSLDKDKIRNAAAEFGRIYEELFAQMNEARVRNGYEPVNHRSGYFPHFQQEGRDGILAQFGKALGIDVEVQQLPTTINGMTHTFKPGIRWFGNALERKGFDTAYDAVEGFDRYIEGVADVVHQTENIQRLRALANQIRYRTSDEGLKEQIRNIQDRTDLTDEQKDVLIRETAKDGKFQLSNFVVELDEYTNLLANKKSRADRNMEQAMGRDMYNIVKGLESRVAANMVAINPGSWLTNFIPITQGWACLDTRHLMKGMLETLQAIREDDGIVDRSSFLTGRQGSDPLVRTASQEWSAKLSKPMEWIDNFTAGTLVRARYRQNLAHMSNEEAMSEADSWAADVMADRSKGATPTLFNRSNPLTKLFTQFQLEVNNQCSYLFKDLPRQKRDEGVKALAMALLKFAVGAWLYNELYEKFLGRRPALDPIDMLTGTVADVMDPETDLADTITYIGGAVAEQTPFIGSLLGGGRIPISSALPDVETLVKAVGNEEWSAGKRMAEAAKELAKPGAYILPPFGGGQIKKIYEALKMVAQGGSYTLDADGNPQLQYPLYSTNSAIQQALELGQALIFGKTTIRSGREWIEGGFGSLTAEQTATYQALLALDVSQADAFDLLTELRGAEKTDEQSKAQIQREILRSSGLEGEALGVVYYDLLASSEKEIAAMEALQAEGADMGIVANVMMDIKDAADSNARRDALRAADLADEEKLEIYRAMISESWDDEIKAFREAGLSMNDFLVAQSAHATIKEQYEDEGDMATAFARWVNQQDYSSTQRTVVRESLKYWQMMAADAARYDKAIDAGLTDEQAYELAEDLDALEPPTGKNSVQDIQKWRAAVDNAYAAENQLQMLQAAGMTGTTYEKVEAAWDMGIAPAAWVRAQEVKSDYDSDGNGNLTNDDWRRLIDGITDFSVATAMSGNTQTFYLTPEQKGILWQMLTGSKSAKNNPFSVSGGEKWLAEMGER